MINFKWKSNYSRWQYMEYKTFRNNCIKEQNRGKRIKFISIISVVVLVGVVATTIFIVKGISSKQQSLSISDKTVPTLILIKDMPKEPEEPEVLKFTGDYETPVMYSLEEEAEVRDITASYAILYDLKSGTVLYEKNSNEKCYPASLTKLLTASVAMNVCKDKDMVFEVGDELAYVEPDASSAFLVQGEKLTLEMLIDALLLPSGGDAAYVIAVNVGRYYANDKDLSTQEALDVFVNLMNITAQEIGATNSNFVTPDGYHNENHYTTASDMLKISLYSMSFPIIKQATSKTYAEYDIVSGEHHIWYNSNEMLAPNSQYYYNKLEGLKTGYTDEAGQCLASYAVDGDMELVGIVMKSAYKADRFYDTEILLEAGFDYLRNYS